MATKMPMKGKMPPKRMPMKGKMTMAMDDSMDRKRRIPEKGPRDRRIDKRRGVK